MLKEQLIISVSFVTSHLCSKMSLSYSALCEGNTCCTSFLYLSLTRCLSPCLSLKCPCWGFYLLVPFEAVASLCLHYLVICEGLRSGAHTVHPIA